VRTTPGGLRIWHEEPDVLRVRLDRPERRNAQTPQMWEDLRGVGAEIDAGTRFVIVDGAAPDFSAGLDRSLFDPSSSGITLASLAQGSPADLDAFVQDAQAAFRLWRTLPVHVIALVSGNAIGAGFQLALAADLMIVHPDASLVLREAALGIIPDLGATASLIPTLGYSRSVALLAGIPITGRQAYEWGVASQVTTDPETSAQELVAYLRGMNPDALRETKAVARAVVAGSDPWDTEREAQLRRLTEIARGLRG